MKKLLMIDADATRASHIARRLRLRGFDCDVATGFLYALTTLEWQRPALLITRTDAIDGMTPTEFCATLKHDPALRAIPTVVIGRFDARASVTFAPFDVLLDEEDTDRLAARLAAIAHQGTDTAASAPVPRTDTRPHSEALNVVNAQGHLSGFLELLELLATALKSGRIVVLSGHPNRPVSVLLDHGQMVHATYGGLEGPPAFRRLVSDLERQEEISYRFEAMPRWQLSTLPRSIRRVERQRLLLMAAGEVEFGTQELDVPVECDTQEG